MNSDNIKTEIKKVKLHHIVILCTGVFLAFAIIGSILLAAGGAWRGNGIELNGLSFGPGQVFEVNDRDEQAPAGVTGIRIRGVSDDITVLHGGDKIVSELKGQCRSASKPVWLEVSRQGGALEIAVKYPPGSVNSTTKLTVTIPDGYQGDLSAATVSGDVQAGGLPFALGDVQMDTVSGNVEFGAEAYRSLKADTTSGEVSVAGAAADTTVNTVSGDVDITYEKFARTTVSTVSGDVKVALPSDAAFSVEFGTVSGNFSSSHPAMDVGGAERGFHGSANGGGDPLRVNTTSGDLTLRARIAG